MGGNVRMTTTSGDVVQGERIPASRARFFATVALSTLVSGLAEEVPGAFNVKTDPTEPDWAAGSTWLMFAMPEPWLARHKREFGDLDVAANEGKRGELAAATAPGLKYGVVTIVAQKVTSSQITLVCFVDEVRQMVQIDIALIPYVDGSPSPLMDLMYRVYPSDVEAGFRGAHSKNFLSSLTAPRRLVDQWFVSGAGGGLKRDTVETHSLSVKGLRSRVAQVPLESATDEPAEPAREGLRRVFKVVRPDPETTYVTNPRQILSLLLESEITSAEVELGRTVTGIADLVDKYLSWEERELVFEKLARKMYAGRRADMSLSADPRVDRTGKLVLKNFLRGRFPDSRVWQEGGPADHLEADYYAERRTQRSQGSS